MDVVIIGGGIQGLVALDALVEKGYSWALVSDGDLGSGQTLHSHGYLNTGFGMFGPELPRASAEVVQPYLAERGVELTHEWVMMPPPGMPAFEGLPSATLPRDFAVPPGLRAVALPDASISKRGVVAVLSQGHRDRILRGHAKAQLTGKRVEAVSVRSADGEIVLGTKAVVVAAGCGTKGVLQSLVGRTPQTEQIKHRRVHMICVRAPRGSLPTTSIVAMPSGLVGPWLNAITLSEIVGGLVDPSNTQPELPGGGVGVKVGDVVEERPDFSWMGWDEWSKKYPQFAVQTSPVS